MIMQRGSILTGGAFEDCCWGVNPVTVCSHEIWNPKHFFSPNTRFFFLLNSVINLNRVCLIKFLSISDKWVLFKQLALVAAAVILSWTIFRSINRARPSLRVTCSFHVTNVGRVDLIHQHLALGLLSVWSRGLMLLAVRWLQKRIDIIQSTNPKRSILKVLSSKLVRKIHILVFSREHRPKGLLLDLAVEDSR